MSEQDDTISQETTNASKTPVAQSVPDTEVALEARNDGEDDVGPLYARFYRFFDARRGIDLGDVQAVVN